LTGPKSRNHRFLSCSHTGSPWEEDRHCSGLELAPCALFSAGSAILALAFALSAFVQPDRALALIQLGTARADTLHEFGHAIGFWHEEDHPQHGSQAPGVCPGTPNTELEPDFLRGLTTPPFTS